MTSVNDVRKRNPFYKVTLLLALSSLSVLAACVKPQPESNDSKESKSITEWQAFSVFHPDSRFVGIPDNAESPSSQALPQKDLESPTTRQQWHSHRIVLGAQALIPILHKTFGSQVRRTGASEKDSWFTRHPSDLFTPGQMQALCDHENAFRFQDESGRFCWRAKVTEEYLAALASFASDACPELVSREINQTNRTNNLLVKSGQPDENSIHFFAKNSLKIPVENISKHWVEDVISYARRGNSDEDVSEKMPVASESFTLACEAMLLSEEFYTR